MDMEIEHFSHQHPLILRDEKKTDEDESCSACTLPISSNPSYGCNQCKEFALHSSCALLPKQIYHPFHPARPDLPRHHLTLLHKIPDDDGEYSCSACSKFWQSGFVYHCAACDFSLDLGCASQATTIKYEGHDHLLTLFDKNYYHHDRLCGSCRTTCLFTPVLRCVYCNFNVHKSCAEQSSATVEFPKKIQLHPFHPLHPLTLSNHPQHPFTCKVCMASNDHFSFRCELCNFTLGVECTSLAPTINYEGHDHLLTFLDNIEGYYMCDSCHDFYRDFVFRCVECDLNLHPQCIPALRTVQHECHVHPLILTRYVAEDDGSGFYCYACETERSPRDPVYYCEECEFPAHIKCVIYEVLPSLTVEQESDTGEKKEKIKPASNTIKPVSNVEGSLGANAVSEVVAKGDNVTVSSEKVGGGITEDLALTKLDERIEKLRMEVEEQTRKLGALATELEALEGERKQYVASKMPSIKN